MSKFRATAFTMVIATAVLAGCASPVYREPVAHQPYPSAPQAYPTASPSYSSYGVVDSIRLAQTGNSNGAGIGGTGIGVGAIAGGVVGGVLGNQVGGGRGKKLATVAGVVGGAMVGHQIEQSNGQQQNVYQIGIRMNNGGYQTITQDSVADMQVGSRVRIENNRAYRY